MQEANCVIVQTTLDSAERAAELAAELIKQRCAACVQRLPVRSTFRWEGEVQSEDEVLLLAKTTADQADRLMDLIRAQHPYDVPEILVTPVTGGYAPYLAWVAEETG